MLIEIQKLLTKEGWKRSWVKVNNHGIITSLEYDRPANAIDHQVAGPMMPGFINSHSHAFQYAMAGMAETVSGRSDTFWSWRARMYELALSISPDQLETIATMLYKEMLRNGTIHVVEFHYLHNESGKKRYANPAELGIRLLRAAEKAGIGITLIPVMYNRGGFAKEAEAHQSRFISADTTAYLNLLEATRQAIETFPAAKVGMGVHSLRAVTVPQLKEVFGQKGTMPFHMHISEQTGEVEDCLAHTGLTPTMLLLNSIPVDQSVFLVHSTHATIDELNQLTKAGTTVILCPSTEGNLGDGIFPMRNYLDMNGRWTVGSDSHVTLSHAEDLRWMDYVQRLQVRRRDTVRKGRKTSGEELFDQCLRGGGDAAGIKWGGAFEIGMPLSGIVLDTNHPLVAGTDTAFILNTIIYSGDVQMYDQVWTFGKKVYDKKTYFEQIRPLRERFTSVIGELGSRK